MSCWVSLGPSLGVSGGSSGSRDRMPGGCLHMDGSTDAKCLCTKFCVGVNFQAENTLLLLQNMGIQHLIPMVKLARVYLPGLLSVILSLVLFIITQSKDKVTLGKFNRRSYKYKDKVTFCRFSRGKIH